MKRIILGLFFILFFCSGNNLFADDSAVINYATPQIVRVGISDNSFSNYLFNKVSVTSDYDFVISDNSTGEIQVPAGNIADISFSKGTFEVVVDKDSILKTNNKLYIISPVGQTINIVGLKRKSKQAKYFGCIELEISKAKPDKFAIVNVLPLQTYLKGVVPNEMPVSFGLEALKAQSILARNYVLKPRENYYKEFDICDSTACQVYFGANTHEPLSDKAVDETENIVVTYENDLILAVYSSTAGGYTESYKNVFMQNMNGRIMSPHVPYLIGVSDVDVLPMDVEERARAFYSSTPETFDNKSPYFRWKYEWTQDELEKILTKTLPTVKNTGFVRTKKDADYTKSDFLGHIKSIFVNKRGESGKVVALTIVTDKNEFTVYKELIIRKVFLYNNKLLPSANIVFDIVPDEMTGKNKIVVTGGGLGHGVGMSQWGAGAMAKKGYEYNDIIHHYYTDVKLAVNPIILKSGNKITREFFIDKSNHKKAVLKFDKNVHFSDLNIIINNKYLDSSDKKKLQKNGIAGITHYLKKGKNVITCEMNVGSKDKQAKFFIELEE